MAKENSVAAVPIKKAAELSNLSLHMLTYLGRIGVLVPSGNSPGRGRRRLYTFSDVLFLRVISELLARGIEVKKLANALRVVKQQADDWLDIRARPHYLLVTDGTEVMLRQRGQLVSKTMNGQLVFAFVLDLAAAHRPLAKMWPKTAIRRTRSA